MRPWMLAGNWKMHNTIEEAVALALAIKQGSEGVKGGTLLSPRSSPRWRAFLKQSEDHTSNWQHRMSFTKKKAPTRERLLRRCFWMSGCEYVIIGHSERRKYFHETDESVNAKVKKALAAGLKPIVCVGETEEEREKGVTEFVVGSQVRKGLYGVESLKNIVIAYEPVWAIGTGKNATPREAQEVHAFIRSLLKKTYGEEAAAVLILYGGSVTKDNIGDLISMDDIDGALVGGASLKSDSFLGIIKAATAK